MDFELKIKDFKVEKSLINGWTIANDALYLFSNSPKHYWRITLSSIEMDELALRSFLRIEFGESVQGEQYRDDVRVTFHGKQTEIEEYSVVHKGYESEKNSIVTVKARVI